MTYDDFEQPPTENIQRGTIVTLAVIPLGVIAWALLWNVGFIASVIAWAVAWLAVKLYRFGSGGIITRTGAIRITVITVVTLVLALFGGLASGEISYWSSQTGASVVSVALDSAFWTAYWPMFPSVVAANGLSIVIALAFGAFGCYSTLRGAFQASGTGNAAPRVLPEPLFPPRDDDRRP